MACNILTKYVETKPPELVFSGPRFSPWDNGGSGEGGGGSGSGNGSGRSWFHGFFLFKSLAFLGFFNHEEENEHYKEYNREEQ